MNIFVINFKKMILFLSVLAIAAAAGGVCSFAVENAKKNDGISCPIVMYHSILPDKDKAGDYIALKEQFTSDLDYLLGHGYSPVTVQSLIDYVYEDAPLPEKPVMLTFDDGFYNNYTYVYPEILERGVPVVISIVGSYTESYTKTDEANPMYSYLRRKDIREMEKSGLVEFQNHSYDLHTINAQKCASMKLRRESKDQYRERLRGDLEQVQKLLYEETGRYPTAFTYPFGKISNESLEVVKEMGFLSSLSCCEGMNYITKSPECLYMLKRYNRPAKYTTEEFMKKLLKP
ncbi:MAG: polysaccharide deacetylase family protein [Clostridia bacterium]|nr:polysaccharide deacetylase family protein [Clostridia bacterium]